MSRLDVVRPQASLRRASGYNPHQASGLEIPAVPLPSSSRAASTPHASSSKPPRPSQPPPTTNNNAMDRRKSRVDGMLARKRQSISHSSQDAYRQAQGGSVPALPAMPMQYASTSDTRAMTLGPGGLNLDEMNSEMFSADDFIARYLSTHPSKSNLENLKQLKANLNTASDQMAEDLQQSVLANYANFMTISKELSALETEMLELKGVLEEWRGVPDTLELSSDGPDFTMGSSLSSSTNRRAARNSIADLAAVYRNQLEALWESVEESSAFTELNSATYKPRGLVHLFLLNDSMLVAIQRRRQMGSKVKLVADKCFTLNEIVVVDLKDGGELQNAIKIKKAKEIFIFCAERPEDKKALLAAFKKVAEEMISKKRKQSIWEAETRRDTDGAVPPLPTESLSSSFDPIAHFGLGKMSTNKDASWIDDVSDELAVLIAMREFEDAVVLAERGRSALPLMKNDPSLSALFKSKLDSRTADLAAGLLKDIHAPSLNKAVAVRIASWLQRLDETDKAREAFLNGRAALVKRRVRQIKFEGDIEAYIGELAIVVFTLVKNTCEWYMAAFRDSKLASGFVQWATQQVELFSAMFLRQVQGADQEHKVTENCLAVTKTHAMVLRDVGLDFGFMFDQLRHGKPLSAMPTPQATAL